MRQPKASNKLTGKKISGKLHLWLGLASGLVVVIVSLTGCLYVFEEEIRNATQKEARFVTPIPNAPFITLAQVEQTVKASFPTDSIKQIRTYSAPDKAWQVQLEHYKMLAINPYNGSIVKQYSKKDWLATVEDMHKNLLLGEVGKWIVRVNVLIFLVLLISGIVLWWPGNKARRKQAFKVKWDASGKRINYDFHNVFGFYSSVFLLLIVLTGMYMSFDWMKQATYFATGSKYEGKPKAALVQPSSKATGGIAAATAYQAASNQFAGAYETHINYPKYANEPLKIKLHYASGTYKKVNDLQYNPYTGELLHASLYANYSAGDKVKHSNRDLHTGAFFGLPGKILAFLFSLVAASMPITGFAIWWIRNKKKKPVKKVLVPKQQLHQQPIGMPQGNMA